MNAKTCLVLLFAALAASAAGAETATIVAWAPGYPGTTEQAQPSMDEFAAGVAQALGGASVSAVYFPTVEDGRAAVAKDAALAIVPLPVWLEYGEALELEPLLGVVLEGVERERWSLVAKKGSLAAPAGLGGWKIESAVGYSPRFVRAVLSGWGALPTDVEIAFNARVLSALRRAAQGDPVAALLDRAQADALPRLPFADQLEVVTAGDALLSSVVCTVGGRVPKERAAAWSDALLSLNATAEGGEVLSTIRVARFERLADAELAAARALWADAKR